MTRRWRHLHFSSTLTVLFAVATGCGEPASWTPSWGPGPSEDITTSVIDTTAYVSTPAGSHCEGPAEELEELGTLCQYHADAVLLVSDAGDVGFVMYGGSGSRTNAILVFGYYGADASVSNHAPDIRYAARYIHDVGGGGSSYASVERDMALWPSGDVLAGAIGTRTAIGDTNCVSGIFTGVAIFAWKNTTITFRFDAAWPC